MQTYERAFLALVPTSSTEANAQKRKAKKAETEKVEVSCPADDLPRVRARSVIAGSQLKYSSFQGDANARNSRQGFETFGADSVRAG